MRAKLNYEHREEMIANGVEKIFLDKIGSNEITVRRLSEDNEWDYKEVLYNKYAFKEEWLTIIDVDGSKKYDSEKQALLIPEICVREILCSGSLYTYAQIFQQIDEPVMNILKGIQEVLLFGAKKYGPNTWQGLPEAHDRYISAWYRHSIKDGNDSESGLPHKYHCWCNLMFLLWHEMKEGDESERYMSQQCSYEKDLRDAKDVLAKAYISGVISKEVIDAAVREIEVVEESWKQRYENILKGIGI